MVQMASVGIEEGRVEVGRSERSLRGGGELGAEEYWMVELFGVKNGK
jgi:hypothetical protein